MPALVLVPSKTAKTSRLGPGSRRTLKRPSESVATRGRPARLGSTGVESLDNSQRTALRRRVGAHRQPPAEGDACAAADDPRSRSLAECPTEAGAEDRARLERVGQDHRLAVGTPGPDGGVAGPVVCGDAELVLARRLVLGAPAGEQDAAGAGGRQRLEWVARAGGPDGDLATGEVRSREAVRHPRRDQLWVVRVRRAGEDDRRGLAVYPQGRRRRWFVFPVRSRRRRR